MDINGVSGVVTGGASGIGAAVARALAARGTRVVVAAVYILINWALSRVARWLEARQRRGGDKAAVAATEAALPQG